MSEMRSILGAATSRSLVLLDEICRGTETAKGTCIAGGILETMDDLGCLGIVSTHLHGIFDLPLDTKNTTHKAMGTLLVDECVKPTWKLLDGICGESLAFETARREGVPEKIIRRARELYDTIHVQRRQLPNLTPHSLSSFSRPFTSLKNTADEFWPPGEEIPVPSHALQKDVENAVTIICQKKLIQLYKKKCTSELVEVTCVPVSAGEQPPPSTTGSSTVYVLLRPDNRLYVGQSDDLAGRIRAHRSRQGLQNSAFLYVIVPGKSVASELETLLINQLPMLGFRLANKADGKHRNFGSSNLSGRSNSSPVHSLAGD